MSENRRKSLRSFYCEEDLWKAMEEQSRERGASMDQLLNDALRTFLGAGESAQPAASSGQVAPAVTAPAPTPPESSSAVPAAPPRPKAEPELPSSASLRGGADHKTLERIPAVKPASRAPALTPPPPPAVKPPPPPPSGVQPAVGAGGMPTLYIAFEGKTYTVDKEKFIIGRGTQGTDLTIRDGNVSRKHAAVIFHTGNFYLQDMGSTNGIEFDGSRIDTKRVEEGDIFHICDHELRFSFQG